MNYISLFIKKLIQYLFIKHIYLFINIQLKTIILLFFLIIVPFYPTTHKGLKRFTFLKGKYTDSVESISF